MLEPLLEEADDVLIVEGVEDRLAVAARTHQPHVAQQPQLVRHGGFAQPEQLGDVADTELGAGDRVEDADARDVAEDLERLGERASPQRVSSENI